MPEAAPTAVIRAGKGPLSCMATPVCQQAPGERKGVSAVLIRTAQGLFPCVNAQVSLIAVFCEGASRLSLRPAPRPGCLRVTAVWQQLVKGCSLVDPAGWGCVHSVALRVGLDA